MSAPAPSARPLVDEPAGGSTLPAPPVTVPRPAPRDPDGGDGGLIIVILVAALLAVVGLAVGIGLLGGTGGGSCASGTIGGSDGGEIPGRLIPIYQRAAAQYRLGVRGPAVLAAINKIETDFGRNLSTSTAGAQGWMQFMPATWQAYGEDADHDGRTDPNAPWDAIFAAAHYLHANGAPGHWPRAIFAYNHAESYVSEVLARAGRYQGTTAAGDCGAAVGSANVRGVVTLRSPRRFQSLPASVTVAGYAGQCDARIVPDILWLAQRFALRAHDCRAAGHNTHGTGISIDLVPASDPHPRVGHTAAAQGWSQVRQAAETLGWKRDCADHGCIGSLVPAIRAIFYNGYANHGDPTHFSGSCGCPHIHISWMASTYAAPALGPPSDWVKAFPVDGIEDR